MLFIGTFPVCKKLRKIALQKEYTVKKPKPLLSELDRSCSQLRTGKIFSKHQSSSRSV
jgi:hypothetical protein